MSNARVVSRDLPAVNSDSANVEVPQRLGKYADMYSMPMMKPRLVGADEGSYFVAQNATPGTGIAKNGAVTAFSDTNALFVLQNTLSASATAKRIYLDQLWLICTTAQAAGIAKHFAFKKSTISRECTTAANRTVVTANNIRRDGAASIAKLTAFNAAGAHTVPASAVADVFCGRICIPCGAEIVHDVTVIDFGGDKGADKAGGAAVRATDPGAYTVSGPPIIVEPGEWLVIHEWSVTEGGAPAYEYMLSWWER